MWTLLTAESKARLREGRTYWVWSVAWKRGVPATYHPGMLTHWQVTHNGHPIPNVTHFHELPPEAPKK